LILFAASELQLCNQHYRWALFR